MASKLVPPRCDGVTISYPEAQIMLVTLSRTKQMNSVTHTMNWQLESLFNWFDQEPSLRVAVITGSGTKAFCAGSDLLEIESAQAAMLEKPLDITRSQPFLHDHPRGGFAGMSRRKGKKPILAAVNGVALGGGFEIVLNADMTIASPNAQFGLPEAQVGVYAYGGGLPRLVRSIGMPAASDIALTGRRVSAKEALQLRLIHSIAQSPDTVLSETLEMAKKISAMSPDGIIITRAALRETWETASIEQAFRLVHEEYFEKLMKGQNSAEGLAAFREKRTPNWKSSKL
ncbi:related to enoyl-CoA hydratase [Ramularia collo-cygni]|uniref:Related to enoyl-CoA hydratase n=1 Tax=Ramularia collo-cygni TaxID=112498 RepID=A0A2D3V7V4_9PEZI|nr:related to enoyl-CoA hydratase [Ramularia collo-cygni]CZT22990.1 related to enoyl-CoA hydratase [Ramularia collo-cygni]